MRCFLSSMRDAFPWAKVPQSKKTINPKILSEITMRNVRKNKNLKNVSKVIFYMGLLLAFYI